MLGNKVQKMICKNTGCSHIYLLTHVSFENKVSLNFQHCFGTDERHRGMTSAMIMLTNAELFNLVHMYTCIWNYKTTKEHISYLSLVEYSCCV